MRLKRGDLLLALLALGSLGLAWLFAKLASEVLEGELLVVDQTVQAWMMTHRSPVVITFSKAITNLGAKEVLIPVGIVLAWFLFRRILAMFALFVFAAIASAEYVAVLKRDFHI